jgi:farnesyl diphosphate synthase
LSFVDRIETYTARVEQLLDRVLPERQRPPQRLHEAMRYAVLSPGKRIRPLLTYATGEALQVPPAQLDAPAVAIELMHAFSLIHDDLPAMDDDDLRRGRPATHRAFDEATAILAADALQPLAFQVIASDPAHQGEPGVKCALVALLAEACGPNGIAGGQSLDLAAEERQPDAAEIEHVCRLKTGRLLRAAVLSAARCRTSCPPGEIQALERFADALGIAYQIQDDVLDLTEPVTDTQMPERRRSSRATYPAVFGIERARERADVLLQRAIAALDPFGAAAQGLRWMAGQTLLRDD